MATYYLTSLEKNDNEPYKLQQRPLNETVELSCAEDLVEKNLILVIALFG